MTDKQNAEKPRPRELDETDLERIAGGMHIEPVVQLDEIEDGKIDVGRASGRG